MITFIVTALGVFILYVLLVAGNPSGEGLGLFISFEELIIGVIVALAVAGIARLMLGKGENELIAKPWMIPVKIGIFLVYLVPWFAALTMANLDVAYRVITGRIRPGIVKISPNLKTNLGRTILANSITLTPGTLTVDVDERKGDLYVHWINVKDTKTDEEKMRGVCGGFPEWARRISE
ncbi:MAG: Na+/H+ antiporter subunit E [Thermoplasmatota archaeon]